MTGDLLRVDDARPYFVALRSYMAGTSIVSVRGLSDVTGIPEAVLRRDILRGSSTSERATAIVAALRRHAAERHACSLTSGLLAEMDAAIARSAARTENTETRFRAQMRARRIKQPSAVIEAARAAGLLPNADIQEVS